MYFQDASGVCCGHVPVPILDIGILVAHAFLDTLFQYRSIPFPRIPTTLIFICCCLRCRWYLHSRGHGNNGQFLKTWSWSAAALRITSSPRGKRAVGSHQWHML